MRTPRRIRDRRLHAAQSDGRNSARGCPLHEHGNPHRDEWIRPGHLGQVVGRYGDLPDERARRNEEPANDVRLRMQGLIPGGNYSVFWGTLGPDSEQPLCPGVERTLPLDAFHDDPQSRDPNSFVAASDGTAEFHGRISDLRREGAKDGPQHSR